MIVHGVKGKINRRACAGLRYILVRQFAMATSNGHKSEMTSSIATKRGIGSLHSALFYSKAYRQNVKPGKLRKWCDFHVETIPLTYMFSQRYQQVGNRAIRHMGDYVQALHWQVSVD